MFESTKDKWQRRKIIVIVDDDESFAELLRKVLEKNNYMCVCARDGKEGIEIARLIKPDLMVLDVDLPELNGYDLCAQVKMMNKKLPVVILTGKFTEPFEKKIGIGLGANDYITKSIGADHLVSRIARILGE